MEIKIMPTEELPVADWAFVKFRGMMVAISPTYPPMAYDTNEEVWKQVMQDDLLDIDKGWFFHA